MTNLLILTALVSTANATPKRTPSSAVAGAIRVHELDCDVPSKDGEHLLGVGYSMTCDTQALAPQYSVRGCALSSHAVVPKAKPHPIPLKETKQDAKHAEFEGAGLEVVLDKEKMKAVVTFDGGAEMTCEEKN